MESFVSIDDISKSFMHVRKSDGPKIAQIK